MKKFARPILWTIFLIYCFVLVYVLFLSRGTRDGFTFAEYMRRFSNFIPFKTIVEYVQRYIDGYRNLSVLNLLGNLALFVPMGMALPCISKKLNRFWKNGRINLACHLRNTGNRCRLTFSMDMLYTDSKMVRLLLKELRMANQDRAMGVVNSESKPHLFNIGSP